ncbi:hypothetical protein ACVWYN_002808 [Pedobacter sp. UYP24]
MKSTKFRYMLLLGTAILSFDMTSVVFAQKGEQHIDRLELFRQQINGFSLGASSNALDIKDVGIPNYALAGFDYSNQNGKFRRPQEADKIQFLGFGANGFQSYKNWHFYGEFNYHKFTKDSIRFANVARPYEGNPFITADSIGGNWRGDEMRAKLQVAYPKIGRWILASDIDYLAEQGNRRNDPRPLYRYLDFKVSQSLGLLINSKNRMSIEASYRRKTEDVETGEFSSTNFKLYSLRGYGTFDYVPVVRAERYTKGWGWQAGLAYKYQFDKGVFLIGARVGYLTEDVGDGNVRDPSTNILNPLLVGGYDEKNAEFYSGYQHRSDYNRGWSVNVNGTLKDGTGYDPRFKGINPASYISNLRLKASIWRPWGKKSWVHADFLPSITYMNYNETIAKTDWTVTQLHNDLRFSLSQRFNGRVQLQIEPLMGYHFPLFSDLVINRATVISNLLVRPDFAYMDTSYLKFQLATALNFKTGSLNYRLSAAYTTLQTQNNSSLNYLQTTIQLLF